MIATHDISAVAAEALLKLDFEGKRSRELQGPRDVTYLEIAKIVGAAIGKPGSRVYPNACGTVETRFNPDGNVSQYGGPAVRNGGRAELGPHESTGTALTTEHNSHDVRELRRRSFPTSLSGASSPRLVYEKLRSRRLRTDRKGLRQRASRKSEFISWLCSALLTASWMTQPDFVLVFI